MFIVPAVRSIYDPISKSCLIGYRIIVNEQNCNVNTREDQYYHNVSIWSPYSLCFVHFKSVSLHATDEFVIIRPDQVLYGSEWFILQRLLFFDWAEWIWVLGVASRFTLLSIRLYFSSCFWVLFVVTMCLLLILWRYFGWNYGKSKTW